MHSLAGVGRKLSGWGGGRWGGGGWGGGGWRGGGGWGGGGTLQTRPPLSLSLCDLSCICRAPLMRHKPCKLAECGQMQANKLACVIKGGAAARGQVLLG